MAANSAKAEKYFISKGVDTFFIGVYEVWQFSMYFFRELFSPPYEFKETIRQCYIIGYRSLLLISITALITGMVFTAHSRPALADFGATSWLPSLSGTAIIKALAPLISSLICAGRIASHIGAELSSMKVTEQVDAMEVSAINPFKFLVVTRVVATTFMVPMLMLYSSCMGLIGSFIDVATNDQVNFDVFIHNAFIKVGYGEIVSSLFRSLVYGFTIGMVGCYKGFNATKGTAGVGKAANSSVVTAMFLIFIEEMVIVKLFTPIYTQR